MNDPVKPPMVKVRRLVQLWNWLPAFRVVAETNHLPTASSELGVTAPALSRSLKLLEGELGQPLFHRVGRRIQLNDAGERFLSTVRAAMRGLDDAIEAISHSSLQGEVCVSAEGHLSQLAVLPAILSLQSAYPGLTLRVTHVSEDVASARLRDGTLDVALLSKPMPHPDLRVEKAIDLKFGIFASKQHPLSRESNASVQKVLDYPFAALTKAPNSQFPAHLERKVGVVVNSYQDLSDLCSSGQFLAMLPPQLAKRAGLQRLHHTVETSQCTYIVYRKSFQSPSKTELVVDELKRGCAIANAPTPQKIKGSPEGFSLLYESGSMPDVGKRTI